MNTKVTWELCQIFDEWLEEDRTLATCVEEIRDWMAEVNLMGIPHFGETASRLEPLRECLDSHFDREEAILKKLADFYPSSSPEVAAFKRQTKLDHHSLSTRIDNLCARLKAVDPQFESWTEAMDEVDVFFEAMEQHERLEMDRVSMLMPKEREEQGGLL